MTSSDAGFDAELLLYIIDQKPKYLNLKKKRKKSKITLN